MIWSKLDLQGLRKTLKVYYKNLIILIFIAVVLSSAGFAYAQVDTFGGDTGITAESLATEAGLGISDPRVIIARIINIALGFLGIIAVLIIMYGGWMWMTAAGNQERIAKAKKILQAGVIGLLIILAAFGIAYFILNVLMDATGGGGEPCGEPGITENRDRTCADGSECADSRTCLESGFWGSWSGNCCINGTDFSAFRVQYIKPPEGIANPPAVYPRNTIIRIYFNLPVDENSISLDGMNRIIVRADGNTLDENNLDYEARGRVIELKAKEGTCPANECSASRCLDTDTEYEVDVRAGSVRTTANIENQGVLGYGDVSFNTGPDDAIDCQNPTIDMSFNNNQFCLDTDNNIAADADDDWAVSQVEFSDSNNNTAFQGSLIDEDEPYEITWHPTEALGYAPMTRYTIYGQVTDLADNTRTDSLNKTLRAAHCCNGVPDEDEEGTDCGGADCGACPDTYCGDPNAGQCSDNNDECASGVCADDGSGECKCQGVPMIEWVSPVGGFCEYPDAPVGFDQRANMAPCQSNGDCPIVYPNSVETKGICNTNSPNGAERNWITIGGRGFGTVNSVMENVLTNIDFEEGTAPNNPNGWRVSDEEADVDIGLSLKEKYSGKQSVYFRQEPNEPYYVACEQDICEGTAAGSLDDYPYADKCNWISEEGVNYCQFEISPQCSMSNCRVKEGRDIPYPYTNRTTRGTLYYNIVNIPFEVGDTYILRFFYKGRLGTIFNFYMSYSPGWASQSWARPGDDNCDYYGDDCTIPPANGGRGVLDPTKKNSGFGCYCIDSGYDDSYCCANSPIQTRPFVAKYFSPSSRINAGIDTGKNWQKFEATFIYTEDMDRWVSYMGVDSRWLAFIINSSNTGVDETTGNGSDFYIDDITFAKLPGEGRVRFLGDISDPDNNGSIAVFPSDLNPACGSTWQDNRIIIAVPEGAEDGPIEVVGESGYSDRTDNSYGPRIDNFYVNDILRAGLCQIDPDEGKFEDEVTLQGINLGIGDYDDVLFGDQPSGGVGNWSDITINNVVVPNIYSGQTLVSVNNSNALPFRVIGVERAPFITEINPEVGHPGDYVTITGGNFGNSKGVSQVMFKDTEVVYDFPPECLNSVWQDTQIVVKVPEVAPENDYRINVKVGAAGIEVENKPIFREKDYCKKTGASCDYNEDCGNGEDAVCIKTAVPGLCRVSPDNGPVGTPVSFYGERFGSTKGSVVFYDNKTVSDNDVIEWTTNQPTHLAKAAVPNGAQTGGVKVLNASVPPLASNALNFQVGSCINAPGLCETEESCCPANTMSAGSCVDDLDECGRVAGSEYAQYYFEFSTASGFEGDEDLVPPKVIEECDRRLNNCTGNEKLPSPAPYTPEPPKIDGIKWTTNDLNQDHLACVNAVITARFDKTMNHSTLKVVDGKTIILRKCAEERLNCLEEVAHSADENKKFVISDSNEGTAFIFTPENLTKDAWYQVTIAGGESGVKSSRGVAMLEDYIWYFKTRSSDTKCNLSCLSVAPNSYTIKKKDDTKEYIATPQQEDNACIILDGSSYYYDWGIKEVDFYEGEKITYKSSQDKAEHVDADNRTNKDTVKALKETNSKQPLHIIASTELNDRVYSGFGELKINFYDFYIKKEFPINLCTETCINAEVGAILSHDIWYDPTDTDTDSEGNITKYKISQEKIGLFKCDTDSTANSCEKSSAVAGSISFDPQILPSSNSRQNIRDKLIFGLGGAWLEPNTWYKAGIRAGASGLKSVDGKELIIPVGAGNVRPETINSIEYLIWMFKTGNKFCEVDEVLVAPDPAIATLVGQKIMHHSEPRSNMMCQDEKQILRGYDHNWRWSSDAVNIAVVPPAGADLNKNPNNSSFNSSTQNVEAVGQGAVSALDNEICELEKNGFDKDEKGQRTMINAEVPATRPQSRSIEGESDFCLVCGHEKDIDCQLYNNFAYTTHGVGSNTCCYLRPKVQESQPDDGTDNICRNALLSVTFNEAMDISSFNGNITVAAKYDDACPEGTNYLLLSKTDELEGRFSKAIKWIKNKISKIPLIGNLISGSAASRLVAEPLVALAENYGSRWCAIQGQASGFNTGEENVQRGVLTFSPTQLLKAGSEHVILIHGDDDLTDEIHRGVRNKHGVSMRGWDEYIAGAQGLRRDYCDDAGDCTLNGNDFYGHIINFWTLPDTAPYEGVCALDHILVDPQFHLFQTRENDTRDDTDNDFQGINDNDHRFDAMAKSVDGQSLAAIPGVYDWTWNWVPGNSDVITAEMLDSDNAVDNNRENPNQAKAWTEYQETYNLTYLRAKATAGAKPHSDLPDDVTGSAEIRVFICNNPWPPYETGVDWPFKDSNRNCNSALTSNQGTCHDTNFEFFYCRDAGGETRADDLPVIDDNDAIWRSRTSGEETILKEFLFTREAKPEAPRLAYVLEGVPKDVNGISPIDVNDIKYLFDNFVSVGGPFSQDDIIRADINLDGDITSIDVILLYKIIFAGGNPINMGDGSVMLIWTSSTNYDFYNIYQKVGNEPYIKTAKVENTQCLALNAFGLDIVCTSNIQNLQNNTPYTFAVTSVKEVEVVGEIQEEESSLSNEITATPRRTSAPDAPTGLTATANGTQISLTWTKNTDPDVNNYRVYLGYSQGGEDEVREVGNTESYTWNVPDTSREYFFKVKAMAGGIESGDSNYIQVEFIEADGEPGVTNVEIKTVP